jgi:hypothetical protein
VILSYENYLEYLYNNHNILPRHASRPFFAVKTASVLLVHFKLQFCWKKLFALVDTYSTNYEPKKSINNIWDVGLYVCYYCLSTGANTLVCLICPNLANSLFILHLSFGRVGIVSGDCSTVKHVTHCGAMVLNGMCPASN